MSEPATVLFVCTGNTCRSPLAASLWALVTSDAEAVSAGVHAWPGMPASDAAVLVAAEFEVDLATHRARTLDDIKDQVDWVLTMTEEQRRLVLAERPDWSDRVELLTEAAGESGDIDDPLGESTAAYRVLAERLLELERKAWRRRHQGIS